MEELVEIADNYLPYLYLPSAIVALQYSALRYPFS